MTSIRASVDQEQAFGRITDLGHHLYELLLDNIRTRLQHLVDYLHNWFEGQSPMLQASIRYLEHNPEEYEQAKKQYFASPNLLSQNKEKSKRSSATVPSNFNAPISEEPESMQAQRQSGRI